MQTEASHPAELCSVPHGLYVEVQKPNLLTRGEKFREIPGQPLKILALLLMAIWPTITEF